MKKILALFVALILVAFTLSAAETQTAPAKKPAKSNPQFDAMKVLVGDWVGNTPYGQTSVRFRIASNGSALMEFMNEGKSEMVTVYHADGDSVMMTHYCSENNQPRMRAKNVTNGVYDFKLIDVTNMASPDELHISGLVLKLQDRDHFTEEWTHSENGKQASSLFTYERRQ